MAKVKKITISKLVPIIGGLLVVTILFGLPRLVTHPSAQISTDNLVVATPSATIMAAGSVRSQNEATLHFATGGKLTYLPFKEGDKVNRGQTLASLDRYALSRQLQLALNTYRITRDSFDQTQANSQDDVLRGQQLFLLQTQNRGGFGPDTVLPDMLKRLLDQSQAGLDNSVINVELQNYALQLASLTAPFNGIVYHQDVTSSQQNVTPATAFTLIDPQALVFKANISEADIDYISVGASVTLTLDALPNASLSGTIARIYPAKITLTSGAHVYPVDIVSDDLSAHAKYDQAGTALITKNVQANVMLVPIWAVLGNRQIWVMAVNHPVLKTVTVGQIHSNQIEILSGLTPGDQIITRPQTVASQKYPIL